VRRVAYEDDYSRFSSHFSEVGVRKTQMVTDRELEILKILWARGKASVREVQDDLNRDAGPVAYSTVQTLLNIMEDKKGLVRHVVEGRTFIYFPKKSSDRTIRELTRRFVDRVFDGALDRVMVALLDSKPPTSDDLDRLRAMIDEAQRQSQENPVRAEEEPVEVS
jgi:predicted transcriptional regulator